VRRLLSDRRGTASLEFALLSVFFFGLCTVALDFGLYIQQKLKLGAAVEQAGLMAFNTRGDFKPENIANYVNAAAGTSIAPETTVTCNQGQPCVNKDRPNVCWSTASKTFVTPPGAACADGAEPGYYVTVATRMRYTSIVVPDRWLGGKDVAQSAVIRLQ